MMKSTFFTGYPAEKVLFLLRNYDRQGRSCFFERREKNWYFFRYKAILEDNKEFFNKHFYTFN
jgi:hypothetical protein